MATCQSLVDEVRRIIHDENSGTYRWTDSEMIRYVNGGARSIVALVPEANSIEEVVTITNSIARQALPAGGIKFMRAARNYADDGTTAQGPITYVEKDVLDRFDPDWEYDTTIKTDAANFFEHYCHDPREPKAYYLYPPQNAANKKVAIVYADNPTAITSLAETWPLGDEYINAGVQYIVYRCLTKEARDTFPTAFRQELWQNYLAALGLERQARKMAGPESPDNTPDEAI